MWVCLWLIKTVPAALLRRCRAWVRCCPHQAVLSPSWRGLQRFAVYDRCLCCRLSCCPHQAELRPSWRGFQRFAVYDRCLCCRLSSCPRKAVLRPSWRGFQRFAVYDRCRPPVMPWPPLLTVLQVGGEGCLGQWCPSLRSG